MDESPYISSASSKGAQPSNASEHGDEIRELVSQMLGSMRITEALDPDVTMAGAEKMFALYPIEACREVAAAESVRVREQYGIAQDVWDALPRHSASKTRVNVLTSE